MTAGTGHRRASLAVKRGIDLIGAAVALAVSLPLTASVAVALLVKQGRPVFFVHERPGRNARPFKLFKFRTMRPTRADEVWYQTDEQRVTPLGRFLRLTSIDELPELINVLRGEMSLVGPRPLIFEYLEHYSPEQMRRHDVLPGVTGWAVVNGRHNLKFNDRLALDSWYVDNWSLRLDFRILWMTLRHLLTRGSVVVTQDLVAMECPLAEASLTSDEGSLTSDEGSLTSDEASLTWDEDRRR